MGNKPQSSNSLLAHLFFHKGYQIQKKKLPLKQMHLIDLYFSRLCMQYHCTKPSFRSFLPPLAIGPINPYDWTA